MDPLFPPPKSTAVKLPEFNRDYELFELTAEDEAVIFDLSLLAAANGMKIEAALAVEHEVVARSMLPGVDADLDELRKQVKTLNRDHLNALFDAASEFNGLEYTRESYEALKGEAALKKS